MNQEVIRRDIALYVHRITGETIRDGDSINDVLMKISSALKTADAKVGKSWKTFRPLLRFKRGPS